MLRKILEKERSKINALPYVTRDLRVKNQKRENEKNRRRSPYTMPTPPSWRAIIGMLFVCYFNIMIFSLR